MKKLFLFLVSVLLFACPILSGCGGGVGADTIVVWQAGLDPNYKATLVQNPYNGTALFTKKIIDKFETDNPGKKVMLKFQGWGEGLNQAITNAIISKEEVDLMPGEVYVQMLIDGDFFAEIPGDYKNIIAPFLYDKYNTPTKTYAVPAYTSSFALYANRTTLTVAGVIKSNGDNTQAFNDSKPGNENIEPLSPATMEDMLTVCEFIKDKYYDVSGNRNGNTGGMIINDIKLDSHWRALAFLRQAGGDFADAQGNVTLDSPANRKAFAMMQALNATAPRNSSGSTYTNNIFDYFYSDKTAYILDGGAVAMQAPSSCDFVVSELPVFEGVNIKSNVVVGTVYYSIPAHSKKQELAKKFIDVLLSDEIQKAAVQIDYRIPAVKSVLDDPEIRTEEYNYSVIKSYMAPFIDSGYQDVKTLHAFSKNISLIWDEWDSFVLSVFTQGNSFLNYIVQAHNNMAGFLNQ